MDALSAPGWLSLLPAAVTIVLAFATRQVLVALFAGILCGSAVVWIESGDLAAANPISRFLLPAIGSSGYAQILLIYLWSLGGLLGLWERTGAARHFAEQLGQRVARSRRGALLFGWLMGVVFHQGGTVSTVLTGSTVRPVADRHGVSHEELSYVVDSTASPVATVLAFNAWPAYVGGLAVGTIPLIRDAAEGQAFFWSAIPFNFYGMLAVAATFAFAMGWLPWSGRRMGVARERALSSGQLDAPGAQPLLAVVPGGFSTPAGYTPSLLDFFVPLGVLLGVAVLPIAFGLGNFINEAFLLAVLSAMLVAGARGLGLGEITGAFVSGCQQMTIGAIVLGLAVTLGGVSKELGTASFLIGVVGEGFSPTLLPPLLMLLCMAIAFATGTSWGTYAVVVPLALPLAWALVPDPGYLRVCFGAVIGGAVFGDQCSPISDTTILSSMFTGCDVMDHVRTQLPLALAVAGIAGLLSTLSALLL